MHNFIGFAIAFFIAITGVGASTITVPLLVLFLGVPMPIAISIGLMFSTVVKSIMVPTQILHRNVKWLTLAYMVAGGVPGVVLGSVFLKHLVNVGSQNLMNAILGTILVTSAGCQMYYFFRPTKKNHASPDRSPILGWLMFPVGAEVGFSSAGAGALGSVALLSLTPLLPAQVVGTDIAFGFIVSLIGSGAHWFSSASDPQLLIHLIGGGVVGSIGGTVFSTHIPRRPLRFALLLWLLILGVQFLLLTSR